jgi:hypothetical protein
MMEAVSTSEISDSFYETKRHCIPGESHVHTWRRENLKSNSTFNVGFSLNVGDEAEFNKFKIDVKWTKQRSIPLVVCISDWPILGAATV